MCLYPRLIKNRKYIANKKNGGRVPVVSDERKRWVPVGCGKCMACSKARGNEWRVRLQEEIKDDKSGRFITFSFSDASLKELTAAIENNEARFDRVNKNFDSIGGYMLDNEIATIGVRRFLERWRKKYKKSVKHWFITELGQKNTERIHLHGLLFTDVSVDVIREVWKYGHVYIGDYVSNVTVNYIVKYMFKQDLKHTGFKSKLLTSSGIGKGYLDKESSENNAFRGKLTKDYYIDSSGNKGALPIYYRNKLYSEFEREELWMNVLDKEIRFVDGVEFDVSKGYDSFYVALDLCRIKSVRLGYGNDEVDWEKRYYENQLRLLKHKSRMNKLNN